MFSRETYIRKWLKEPTLWGLESVPRGKILLKFVEDDLVPFVESRGYKFGRNVSELFTYIATGLYMNEGRSTMDSEWTDVPYNADGTAEERIHYYDSIDVDAWAKFWDKICDWDEVGLCRERQIDIEEFVWRQLDLDSSPQTEILYYRMNDDTFDETDDVGKKADIYLEETSGWGGLRK